MAQGSNGWRPDRRERLVEVVGLEPTALSDVSSGMCVELPFQPI